MNKIIIIIGSVAVVLVLALVLVWPQYQKLQSLNSDIKSKQQELQSQEAYFAQVKETATQLQEYSDALLKISNALPEDPSLAALANFLQTNASQTGLILKKIVLGGTTAPSGKKGAFAETQLTIQVSGSYKAFGDFLSLIENSSRMIEVQNISIEVPPKESKESSVFTLNLKTNSY